MVKGIEKTAEPGQHGSGRTSRDKFRVGRKEREDEVVEEKSRASDVRHSHAESRIMCGTFIYTRATGLKR